VPLSLTWTGGILLHGGRQAHWPGSSRTISHWSRNSDLLSAMAVELRIADDAIDAFACRHHHRLSSSTRQRIALSDLQYLGTLRSNNAPLRA